jgi:transcriptional regulator with XRE-family HTH domain
MNIESSQNELERFGKMIRERRTVLGMTLETLAEKANRSDREVRDIELGKVEPKFRTALLLCDACHVDVGELKAFVPQEDLTYA